MSTPQTMIENRLRGALWGMFVGMHLHLLHIGISE